MDQHCERQDLAIYAGEAHQPGKARNVIAQARWNRSIL